MNTKLDLLLLAQPWEARRSTIVVEPCPLGDECPREIVEHDYSDYGVDKGHIVGESMSEAIARYLVELHNEKVLG